MTDGQHHARGRAGDLEAPGPNRQKDRCSRLFSQAHFRSEVITLPSSCWVRSGSFGQISAHLLPARATPQPPQPPAGPPDSAPRFSLLRDPPVPPNTPEVKLHREAQRLSYKAQSRQGQLCALGRPRTPLRARSPGACAQAEQRGDVPTPQAGRESPGRGTTMRQPPASMPQHALCGRTHVLVLGAEAAWPGLWYLAPRPWPADSAVSANSSESNSCLQQPPALTAPRRPWTRAAPSSLCPQTCTSWAGVRLRGWLGCP